ncbi:MAG: ABC transporter substrate-binding protein [Chloroflexi bacterium]|nr:ABC transporter substrate-binding protein [Chloroflexota bacterium]
MPEWMRRHKLLLIVGAMFVGLLVFAACNGNGDDDGDDVTPADGETPAATTAVEALAAICFPESCRTALREAIEQGLIDQFIFVDGSKSQDMFDDIGVENFEGMSGTAPGAADPDLAEAFEDAYNASEFGPIPALPFLRESYDAVYLIALAAAAANSTDSEDIRDNLRYIANPGGEVINPGTAGFTTALELLEAGEDIDYEGAAGPQDFDANGDVAKGAIEIWKIVDGEITVQSSTVSDLGTAAEGTLSRADTTPTDPLKIGILVPFTGDLSDFGPAFFDAAKLAAQEINAAGGVFGQDIVLVDADTGTIEATGIESANTLIDVEGVSAIVGAASSAVTLPIAESVTGPAGILMISPSSTSPALTEVADNDFLFRSTISDAAQGVVLAELAIDLGFTSVCTFFVNTAYGEGLADQFKETFEALGGTVPAAVPHEQEQTSYVSELQTCVGG